jgi:hypothetical protein
VESLAEVRAGLEEVLASAYRRLQSARLLQQVPSVVEKLESGALNLSQLTQVQKCLKEEMRTSGNFLSQEKTEKLLVDIEHKNTFETKKFLALEFNQPIQSTEILKPQADDSVRLEVTFTQEEFAELKKAKELKKDIDDKKLDLLQKKKSDWQDQKDADAMVKKQESLNEELKKS